MRRAFPSVFLSIPLSFFFLIKAVSFSRCQGRDNWFHCSSVPDGHKYTSLQSSLNELLETMGEGRRTAKTQAVCLELSPLCSILGFPLPTQPLHPASPPARVIRGAYTGAVQAYLTFSICNILCPNIYLAYTLPKRCSEMQNLFEVTRTTEILL